MHTSSQPSPIVLQQPTPVPQELVPRRSLHVAIISDGNGRWATSRGLPRSAGHRAGAQSARRIIAAAPALGIHTLTLFALSSANWKRPPAEVQAILRLLHEYLLTETSNCIAEGVRLSIIGRRDPCQQQRRSEPRGVTRHDDRDDLPIVHAIKIVTRHAFYRHVLANVHTR